MFSIPHTEHGGDQLLRHHQFIGSAAIKRQQQPAAQALFDRMMTIARRRTGRGIASHEECNANNTFVANPARTPSFPVAKAPTQARNAAARIRLVAMLPADGSGQGCA